MTILHVNEDPLRRANVLVIGVHDDFIERFHPMFQQLNALLDEGLVDLLQHNQQSIIKVYTLNKMTVDWIYFFRVNKSKVNSSINQLHTFGEIIKELEKDQMEKVNFLLDTFTLPDENNDQYIRSLAEAVRLATYKIPHYKTTETSFFVEEITMIHPAEDSALHLMNVGSVVAEGVNYSRDLINRPSNLLTPNDLAKEAIKLAEQYNLQYEILNEGIMEELGMDALLAVSKGSAEEAQLITLQYTGNKDSDSVIGLVGKGVTFDAGGYSIKGATGMENMKCDMSGAATVLGTLKAVAELELQVNLLVVIPATENLINGHAMKPGDVIRTMSGKTIEVKNTDAEGRIILAEAITYAREKGVTSLIDVATLTSAMGITFAREASGAITNDDRFYKQLQTAAHLSGEHIWQLPTFDIYKDMVRNSDVADISNMPGPYGASITAGLFLKEFVEETPWIHLDIASTAFAREPSPIRQKGGTGVMVRTLTYLLENMKK